MLKTWLIIGALSMALAVGLGAFGAHGLKSRLTPDLLAIWHTGVDYHFYHALGLLLVAVSMGFFPDASGLRWAAGLMLVGMLVFSGSLYVLALTGLRWLGAITPLGGLSLIAAWVTMAWTLWKASV
jgi:uncharacterized membrane protein YgdD (TMEM256/DUF423 family)